jgi:hypothetical protein
VLDRGLLRGPALLEGRGREGCMLLGLLAGRLGGGARPLLGLGRGLVRGAGGLGVLLCLLLGLLTRLDLGQGLGVGALPLLLGLGHEVGVLVGLLGGGIGHLAGPVLGLGTFEERLLGEGGLLGRGFVGGTACLGCDRGGVLRGPPVVECDPGERRVLVGLLGRVLGCRASPLLGIGRQGVRLLGQLGVPGGLLLGGQPGLGLLACGPLELLALLLGLADQGGVLVGRLGGLLGKLEGPLLGSGPLGQRLLGDLCVVAGGALGVGARGLGLLREHRGLAGGLLGSLALGQLRDHSLGELGRVPLGRLPLGRLGLGQRDVLASGALCGLAGPGGALGQLLGLLALAGVLGGGALGLFARLVCERRGVRVLLGQPVRLCPRLDRLPRHLFGDEPFRRLFGRGKLGIAPELDGLVGSAGVARRSHR